MKKNTMMRLASALLVLVLLTTCAISGTFAKYTSAAGGEDIARVAYWGFGTNPDLVIDDLFKTAYVGNEVKSAGAMDTTVTDIIAPGTTNSANFGFAYTNYQTDKITAPEVAYTLTITTTGSSIAEDIKTNTNIQWKLDNGEWGTWDQMIAAIEALDGDKTYAPGEIADAFKPGVTHTVAWQWLFETAGEGMAAQDAIDTAMGNKQTLDQVKLVINVTAVQVDELAANP